MRSAGRHGRSSQIHGIDDHRRARTLYAMWVAPEARAHAVQGTPWSRPAFALGALAGGARGRPAGQRTAPRCAPALCALWVRRRPASARRSARARRSRPDGAGGASTRRSSWASSTSRPTRSPTAGLPRPRRGGRHGLAAAAPTAPTSSTSAARRPTRAPQPVDAAEELRRVLPVIERLAAAGAARLDRHDEGRGRAGRGRAPARPSSTTSRAACSIPAMAAAVADLRRHLHRRALAGALARRGVRGRGLASSWQTVAAELGRAARALPPTARVLGRPGHRLWQGRRSGGQCRAASTCG